MKKFIGLLSTIILVSVELLTPFAYAWDFDVDNKILEEKVSTEDSAISERINDASNARESNEEISNEESSNTEEDIVEEIITHEPENEIEDILESFTVIFYDENDEIIKEEQVYSGDTVSQLNIEDERNETCELVWLQNGEEYDFSLLIINNVDLHESRVCEKENVLDNDVLEDIEPIIGENKLDLKTIPESIAITFDTNWEEFLDGEETKTITFNRVEGLDDTLYYAHTANINDQWERDWYYANNLNEITSINIEGAISLNVKLRISTESLWYDYLTLEQDGNVLVEDYFWKKIGFSWRLGWTPQKLTKETASYYEYNIKGNSLDFRFISDGSQSFYWYYAVIKANKYEPAINNFQNEIRQISNKDFLWWIDWIGDSMDLTKEYTDDYTLYSNWWTYLYEQNWIRISYWTNIADRDIIISDISNWNEAIIKDKNIWAISNDINSNASYGCYFRWWNNYPFKCDTANNEYVDTYWKRYWPWNWYYKNTTSVAQWDNINYWWWGDDWADNWWTKNWRWRQWPCPEWYHVPSRWELSNLVNLFNKFNLKSEWSFNIIFMIPLAWWLNGDSVQALSKWYYWTSTPYIGSNNAYVLKINWGGDVTTDSKSDWYPIRCFKDSDDVEYFDLDFDIDWNKTLIPWQIIKSWHKAKDPEYSINEEQIPRYDVSWNEFDFTSNVISGNITLYSNYYDTEGTGSSATLLPWEQFNAKLKKLTNGWNANKDTIDSSIVSFQKYEGDDPDLVNSVEIQESWDPVYARFDNGIIYYYTNAGKIYLNSNSQSMFYRFTTLTWFDFTRFDTKFVENMSWMFWYCSKLETVNMRWIHLENLTNLSNIFYSCGSLKDVDMNSIKLGNLTSFENLFKDCTHLETVDLTNANLWSLVNMKQMFWNTSIKSLDFTNMDASHVVYIDNMIGSCNSLETINMHGVDMRSVQTMEWFLKDRSIKSVDMSDMIISGATNIKYLFWNCQNLETIDMSNVDARSVKYIVSMFWNTGKLKSVNLKNADLRSVESMNDMYREHSTLEEIDMEWVNASSATSMQYMFYNSPKIRKLNVRNMDISSMKNMNNMFKNATGFTGLTLDFKNTDNLETMSSMFEWATNLVELNIREMNLDNVTNMNYFLKGCTSITGVDFSWMSFNNVVSMIQFFNWDISLKKVDFSNTILTNLQDINHFFLNCTWLEEVNMQHMQAWSLTNITNMFNGTTSLKKVNMDYANMSSIGWINVMLLNNKSLEEVSMEWLDIRNATAINHLFNWCTNLREVNLSGLIASNVTNVSNLFASTSNLKKVNMRNADLSSVTNISQLFFQHPSIEEVDMENFNVSSATTLQYMFQDTPNLKKINIKNMDISSAKYLDYMFRRSTSLTGFTLNFKNTNNVESMESMFEWARNLTDLNMKEMNYDNVINMNYFLRNAISLTGIDLSWMIMNNVEKMVYFFNWCTGLETINMSNMQLRNLANVWSIFWGTTSLKKVDMSYTDISGIGSISDLLKDNKSVEEVTLEWMNVSSSTSLVSLFNWCINLKEVNMSGMIASSTTSANAMFNWTTSLKKINMNGVDMWSLTSLQEFLKNNKSVEEINMSWMNLSSLTSMNSSFYWCSNLKSINLSNINVPQLTAINHLFYECTWLTNANFDWFIADNLTNMNYSFYKCNSLKTLDLSSFNTTNVTAMERMFSNDENLKTVYVSLNFNTDKVNNSNNMFDWVIAIVWWNWTTYDVNKKNKDYAKIDDENTIGYFTNKNHFALRFKSPAWLSLWTQWRNIWTTGNKLNNGDLSILYYTDSSQQSEFDFEEPLIWYTEVYTIWDNIVYQIKFYNADNETIYSGISAQAWAFLPMKRYYTHPNRTWKYRFDWWYKSSTDFSIKNRFEFDKQIIEDDLNLYPHRLEFNDVTYFDAEDPTTRVTYMDRNLWAITDEIGDNWSIGYYYQRWNNHGFSRVQTGSKAFSWWSKETVTNTKFSWLTNYWPTNPFYRSIFYYSSDYWADPWNDNIYWWNWDNWTNIWWLAWNNYSERQWPCPDWYHIPSIWELDKLLDMWLKNKYLKQNISLWVFQHTSFSTGVRSQLFQEELLLPSAWFRYSYDYLVQRQWTNAIYLSSTPGRWLSFSNDATDTYQWVSRASWQSIRCFKNQTDELETYSVTFNSKWWTSIPTLYSEKNKTLKKLPKTPIKNNTIFSWWYLSWTNELFDLTSIITEDIILNALYYCEDGYHLSEDEEACELNNYVITFLDEDWAEILSGIYHSWDIPTPPSDPIKSSTAQYSYSFWWWFPELEIVTWDAIYTATYISTINKYTITRENSDWTILDEQQLEYWTQPSYSWSIPMSGSSVQYHYNFIWWSPEESKVIGPQVYTASYSNNLRSYEINAILWTGVESIIWAWIYNYWTYVILTWKAMTWYHFESWASYTTTWITLVWETTIKMTAKPNHYKVVFVSPDSQWTMEDQEFVYNETWVLNANTFIKPWYSFSWWKDELDNYYSGEQEIFNLITSWFMTLEAQWELIPIEEDIPQKISAWWWRVIKTENNKAQEEHWSADIDNNQESWTIENDNSSVNKESLTECDKEILSAYEWAYKHNITTLPTLERANPEWTVKRWHLAKMVVNYATNVLWREIPEKIPSYCRWNDRRTDRESEEIKDYAVKSCALWLMWLDMEKFLPNMEVTRAQFWTIMSRLLWWKKYAWWTPYYRKHLNALKENNIMTQIENPEKRVELRQWVWLMLMRSSKDNK